MTTKWNKWWTKWSKIQRWWKRTTKCRRGRSSRMINLQTSWIWWTLRWWNRLLQWWKKTQTFFCRPKKRWECNSKLKVLIPFQIRQCSHNNQPVRRLLRQRRKQKAELAPKTTQLLRKLKILASALRLIKEPRLRLRCNLRAVWAECRVWVVCKVWVECQVWVTWTWQTWWTIRWWKKWWITLRW